MTAAFLHPQGPFHLSAGSRQRMTLAGLLAALIVVGGVCASLVLVGMERAAKPLNPEIVDVFFPPRTHPLPPQETPPSGVAVKKDGTPVAVEEARATPDRDLKDPGIPGIQGSLDPGADIGRDLQLGKWPDAQPRRVIEPGEPIPDEMPQLVFYVTPRYPDFARESGIEGRVLLKLRVGADGSVVRAVVERGIPVLNEAAVDAALKYRFKPALAGGRPVEVWVLLPVTFRLHNN